MTPADEARAEVVGAALRCLLAQHTTDENSESALEMLDLSAVRLVAELEAERAS